MTIGELSQRTGIAPSAIRYYEQERLLPQAPRTGGRRVFDETTVAQLEVVQVARDAGFTIAEIRQLVSQFNSSRWRPLAERKRAEIAETIRRLQLMAELLERLMKCGCFDLETCGTVLARRRR